MEYVISTIAETRGPTDSEKLWLIGLTVGTLLGLFVLGYCIMKLRRWLKSDISVGGNSVFDFEKIRQMHQKGLISSEEYARLKEAYARKL